MRNIFLLFFGFFLFPGIVFSDTDDCVFLEFNSGFEENIVGCGTLDFTLNFCTTCTNFDDFIIKVHYNDNILTVSDPGNFDSDNSGVLTLNTTLVAQDCAMFSFSMEANSFTSIFLTAGVFLPDGTLLTITSGTLSYQEYEEVNGVLSEILAQPNSPLLQQTDACVTDAPPQRLIITDELIIDTDYCFYNSDIVMGPNAIISLENGAELRLFLTKIYGCEAMWDKIHVKSGSSILSFFSTIEDALIGVYAENDAFVFFQRTSFINNYSGFSYINPEDETNAATFLGCSFWGEGSLKPPFNGMKPLAGIFTTDLDHLLIGFSPPHPILDPQNFAGTYGGFSNLSNGVIIRNTNLEIPGGFPGKLKFEEIDGISNFFFPGGHAVDCRDVDNNTLRYLKIKVLRQISWIKPKRLKYEASCARSLEGRKKCV